MLTSKCCTLIGKDMRIKGITWHRVSYRRLLFSGVLVALIAVAGSGVVRAQVENPQQDSVGIQGKIPSPPPTTGATISIPRNGQTFTDIPVTVSGICPDGLLVKIFKNNVFAGSVQCTGGSYSIIIDLFSGQNELIARVYDALDQPGPDSNKIIAIFVDNRVGARSRVTLTSNFAKRGANPGQELEWPIILSGGIGPYAISVDWGDGKTPDLISQEFPGTINIKHVYDSPGVYNIIVKATDRDGGVAYLQLVGIANGPLSQENGGGAATSENIDASVTKTRIIWQPAALAIPFVFSTFWLGKKYELRMLRNKIERGERPF